MIGAVHAVDPAKRTALRELDMRLTSPSSVNVTKAVSSPTPNWVISARQAGLVTSDIAQLALQLALLPVEHVDHSQSNHDTL